MIGHQENEEEKEITSSFLPLPSTVMCRPAVCSKHDDGKVRETCLRVLVEQLEFGPEKRLFPVSVVYFHRRPPEHHASSRLRVAIALTRISFASIFGQVYPACVEL